MSKDSEAFQGQFKEEAYPAAFTQKYEIIECLAAPTCGETLLVLDRGENAYRVAKRVADGVFETERNALSSLSHPGLPHLCDWIPDGDEVILIRSYVEGKPLDMVCKERALSEPEIIGIGVQLCDILTYLHTRKPPIIHRDVKPQNVILGPDGNVTLIDFGIARAYKPGAEKDTTLTGTNDFAPPEQYGFTQTDARSDIFAFGKLMQFLLTGGDAEGKIPNPALRRVVRRCCAFSPASRYPSAQAVKRALKRVGSGRMRRCAIAALTLVSLLVGFAIGRYALPYTPPPKAATFAEPVIEAAVRGALNMPEGALYVDALSCVTELYIVHDAAQSSADGFFGALNIWSQNAREGTVSGEGIKTFEDLALLPNLASLCVASGTYPNLDGLAGCAALEHVELYNNDSLTDISALQSAPLLRYVGLIACNRVSDLSALAGHDSLTDMDLTGWQPDFDYAALEGMGDFYSLSLSGGSEAYRYVHDKNIGWLRLNSTGLTSMEPLATVTGLWRLDVTDTPLSSLDGVEAHAGLTTLNIARTAVSDLTPLLGLPALAELVLSQDMSVDTSVLSDMNGLTIRYE